MVVLEVYFLEILPFIPSARKRKSRMNQNKLQYIYLFLVGGKHCWAPVSHISLLLIFVLYLHYILRLDTVFSLSYQKWYFNGGDKVFPFLTAIIDVENGVVRGITWDDASIFCSPDEAERNTFDFNGLAGSEEKFGQPVEGCFLSLKNECTVQTETGTQCDLLLYVVWTGTDSKGNSFLSSSYRFSAFPAQDWSDRIMNNLPEFKIPDLNPFDDGGGNEGE